MRIKGFPEDVEKLDSSNVLAYSKAGRGVRNNY